MSVPCGNASRLIRKKDAAFDVEAFRLPITTNETAHDWGKRLHTRIGNDDVGEPVLLASPQQILDDLIARANNDGWHVQNVLDSNATPPPFTRELFGSLTPLLCKDGGHVHVQF